jgi:hypothetical protein
MRALVRYELAGAAAVCDLDDADTLAGLGLRPSQVVTRDRNVTQAWALKLYEVGGHVGVRWWSCYDPRWGSYAFWDTSSLRVAEIEVLTEVTHPAFVEAAGVLCRLVER